MDDKTQISESIEKIIDSSIEKYKKFSGIEQYKLDNCFEQLISIGELIDRLSIVNFKLYKLKDEVMNKIHDIKFTSWAAEEDIKLVIERSRLKKCIDEKFFNICTRAINNDMQNKFNPEVKKYGK